MVHLPCGGAVPRSKLPSEVVLSSTKPAKPQSRWTGQPWPAPIPALQQPPRNKAGLLLPNALLHTPVSFMISPCILLLYGLENLIPDLSSLSYHQQWRKARGEGSMRAGTLPIHLLWCRSARRLFSGNFPWPEHMLWGPFLIMICWGSVAFSELGVEHLVLAFKEGGGQRNQHSWVHCHLGWPREGSSSIWIDSLGPPDHQEAHTEAAGSSSGWSLGSLSLLPVRGHLGGLILHRTTIFLSETWGGVVMKRELLCPFIVWLSSFFLSLFINFCSS